MSGGSQPHKRSEQGITQVIREHRSILGIALIVAIVRLMWLWEIGQNQSTSSLVVSVGLVASGLGVVLSVFGFGLAIAQISRTETAAKAAEDAVNSIRMKVTVIDAVSVLERAVMGIGAARESLRQNQSTQASEQLENTRAAFVKLAEFGIEALSQHQEQIAAVPDEIATMIDSIEGAQPDMAMIKGYLRSHSDLLHKLQVRMQTASLS